MEWIDRIAMGSFILGAAATAALAFTINRSEETSMSKAQGQLTTEAAPSQVTTEAPPGLPSGYNGPGKIGPDAAGERRGYSGAGKVKPGGSGQSGSGSGGSGQG